MTAIIVLKLSESGVAQCSTYKSWLHVVEPATGYMTITILLYIEHNNRDN